MPTRLHPFDLALIAVYLIGITLFGLRFRKSASGGKADKSLKNYFLANNTVPWWAIALSIVSAETSTLTIISIPGVAFAGDFGFLQVVLGYLVGRIIVALLFLPKYFQGQMLTAYQLIDQRFGPTLHKVTAGLFLLTRAAAEGVRVFAVSIVVGIAIGTNDTLSIGIISALTLLYTFEGGMAAVIWTDVVQMAIYIGGTFVAISTLGHAVPGGWQHIHAVAGAAGKFHLFNFAFNLTQSYTFWAGLLGGTFLTMASHGTDQLMVQRMLAARNLRESRLALLSSGVVILLQFTLFLLIGAGLYVFYGLDSSGAPFITQSHHVMGGVANLSPDRIFPTFIVTQMPIGIAGLLIAAILAAAMSNLSAALNSLSSTTVVDFYMHWRPNADDRERMLISRSSTVLWAFVLFAIAVYSIHAGGKGHVVETGLSIASVAYGCLLGVFLLGTLTKYATQTGTIIGMICGFALNLWLWQGTFPITIAAITIPKIAFTWFVIIGAIATFAIGSLASLIFRKPRAVVIAAAFLTPLLCTTNILAQKPGAPYLDSEMWASRGARPLLPMPAQAKTSTTYDFSGVDQVINDAIANNKLPGAVVLIGHNGKIAYEHAYGLRKVAGEPGPDGKPSPAEPMTEDTIFDMASLTKCLATATAIMQLYEAGKIASFDDPVAKYLPDFAQNGKQNVTIRELLAHYSGLPPDISLKDPWGLAKPDRAEGIRRAMAAPLANQPGTKFVYSDINFIALGVLVEKLSGETEDVYASEHIFKPLGMTLTRYLPLDKAYCNGDDVIVGAAIGPIRAKYIDCLVRQFPWWMPSEFVPYIAPTTHDDEGNAETNPHFNMLTRGTVHDPTTRRMGGVAGHAGVFSTAHDVSLFAQALLDKLLYDKGPFPLKQSTLKLMVAPQQPATAESTATIFDAHGMPDKGVAIHAYGWDINTAYSRPRGAIFPIGSFGHTGFTGTSLWMDPASDSYVILLANAIHPRGRATISPLRGLVATAAAKALGLDRSLGMTIKPQVIAPIAGDRIAIGLQATQTTVDSHESHQGKSAPVTTNPTCDDLRPPSKEELALRQKCIDQGFQDCSGEMVSCQPFTPVGPEPSTALTSILESDSLTLTGIDTLEATRFSALSDAAVRHHGTLRLGLLTNQTGLDAKGRRTIDILNTDAPKAVPGLALKTLFSPEHGILGALDSEQVAGGRDPATHLPVISLYGAYDADRRPKLEDLKGLDAVIIDLQDAGVRFYTYDTVVGYFLEAAAQAHIEIIVLDRPNLIGGDAVQGPVSDLGTESYINYMPLPSRHGLTIGELARYINGERRTPSPTSPNVLAPIGAALTVIPIQHWQRSEYYDATGLPWINPSPNLRNMTAATIYPGLGFLDATNVSVGRGTSAPFEQFGAGFTPKTKTAPEKPAWFKGPQVADYLNARHIPGVSFAATTIPVAEDENHYPYHGQTIQGVKISVTDRNALNSPELGIEILSALHHLYPADFKLERAKNLLCNQDTLQAIAIGNDPRTIAASWTADLNAFKKRREPYLLY